MGSVRPVLRLVKDWVGMWMGHILQWVQLQGRSTGGGGGTRSEDLAEVGQFAEVDGGVSLGN